MKNIDKSFTPEALRDVLERRLGIPLSSSFVVAYSGGRDSHVLLHALHALRPARLRAVHVDHNLQSVSRAWFEHCQRVCATLNVECVVEHIDVRREDEESVEAAARRLRYERLAAHLADGDVLLTAHHEDDQAETLLLALLRGAGARGLAAMPPLADFGVGRHARPLLGFARAALEDYAHAHELVYVDDTSNRDERMSRNFLRARVLPLLEQRWPATMRVIARAASNNADTAALLDEIGQTDLTHCRADDGLSLAALASLSASRQRNVVRYWMRTNGFDAPSSEHLELILAQVNRPSATGQACIDWQGIEVRRYRDRLIVQRHAATPETDLQLPWTPPQTLMIPGTDLQLHAQSVRGQGLSQARLANATVTVRTRRGGETCLLPGRGHHKLKKLLQEAGVPPWERERLPLIYVGDELAAVADRWICEPFTAREDELGWRILLERTTTF